MDNLKCLSDHVSAHISVDLFDTYETLRKELLKSIKIAKKFKEELKLATQQNSVFTLINEILFSVNFIIPLQPNNHVKNKFLHSFFVI